MLIWIDSTDSTTASSQTLTFVSSDWYGTQTLEWTWTGADYDTTTLVIDEPAQDVPEPIEQEWTHAEKRDRWPTRLVPRVPMRVGRRHRQRTCTARNLRWPRP